MLWIYRFDSLLPDETVNNSGAIQTAVSFHCHIFGISSDYLYRQYPSSPMEGALHPSSKSANILKAAHQNCHILKVLQLFKGDAVFVAFHWRVCYFQTKVSVI